MAATPAKPAAGKLDPAVIRTALILVVGGLAVVFDTTIVSVALHTLSVKLHTSVTTIQWASTGYLLALGIAVPLSTWGLQRFGGKRLWIFSLAVFLVGSVGSSLGGAFGTAVLAVILEGAIATHPATLADAFHLAFWWSAGFSAVAVLLSLWLPGAQRAPETSRGSAPGQRTDPVRA
jgi:MFS family permease